MNIEHLGMKSLDIPHSSSFHTSLNSIDENKTITEFNDFAFTSQQHPDIFQSSDDFLYEKRQSEPAIRFSFYNKLFDFEGGRTQRLLPPPRDFRKYSLPLSMYSSQPECPISSLMSPSCKFAVDVPTWRSFNTCFLPKSNQCDVKFKLTINDEDGQEIKNSSFETMTPMDDYDEENCLFYEENSMKRKNQFENNFIDDDDSLNSDKNEKKICHKCGHAKLKKIIQK